MLENPFAFESAVCLRSRGMEGVQELVVTPVTCQLLPGSKFEDQCLVRAVERFRKASSVRRVCVIADRGVMSAAKLRLPENAGLNWILEARLRAPSNERQEDLDSSVTPLAAGAGKSSLRRMETVESDRGHLVAHRRQRQEELCKYREELKLSDSHSAFAGRGQGRFRITEGTGRVKVEVRASCAVGMRTGRWDWLGRRPWRWPQELVNGEGVGVDPLGGVQHVVYCEPTPSSTAKAFGRQPVLQVTAEMVDR